MPGLDFKMTIQTPAGFEFDCEMAPDQMIIGVTVSGDEATVRVADELGEDDLSLAEAIIDELINAGMDVLSASMRGVALSHEWLVKLYEKGE